MKKNCNIIKDLLPLYLDKVCSNEATTLVEEHLKTCAECRNYLEELQSNIKTDDKKEIKVIKNFAKKINYRILVIVGICVCVLSLAFVGISKAYYRYRYTVAYDDNMKVTLLGNKKKWNFVLEAAISGVTRGVNIKRVENGGDENIIFISQESSLPDYFDAKKGVRSGSVPELDYANIDITLPTKVYYTEEDLAKVKNATEEELQEIIKSSHLIFSKDTKTTKINCELEGKDYEYLLTYYKVSGQIIDSVENDYLPGDLTGHIYSIDGEYDSVWFPGDTANEIFKKTEDYMVKHGGVCTRTDVE